MNLDVQVISRHSSRAEIEAALILLRAEQKTIHPSPRRDQMNDMIDQLLTLWQQAAA